MRPAAGLSVVAAVVALSLLLNSTAASAAPPGGASPAVIAPGGRPAVVKPPLPFDISIDSVAIGWSPMRVTATVRVQGVDPGVAEIDRHLTCWFTYSGFPPEALRPPTGGGAYVFTEPAKSERADVSYLTAGGPTHAVTIPFATLANEVTVRCEASPDDAETNRKNNRGGAFATRPPQPGQPLRYLLEVRAAPLNDAGNHLRVLVRYTNPTATLLQNLRLILVKNHLALKEWKPIGIHASGAAQVHLDDAMPAQFTTNTYEAILTTDLASPVPPPASILDRRTTSYRTSGTLHGTP